ncbi:hypothetical protein C7K25_10040 [Gulosibacter molinativorax]|uniref:Uncharacterized protein n=1 Tax=Gulosibacter molinativorax TaxID=256821 RepID=A0ABT7C974_9MICO|nr:hypothetical protein [Gulosibacter molinativorax]
MRQELIRVLGMERMPGCSWSIWHSSWNMPVQRMSLFVLTLHWALGIGHWALGIGHWALVVWFCAIRS